MTRQKSFLNEDELQYLKALKKKKPESKIPWLPRTSNYFITALQLSSPFQDFNFLSLSYLLTFGYLCP